MQKSMVGNRGFHRAGSIFRWLVPLLVLPLFTTACEDETVVYRDRVQFEPVPDVAMNFVGYSDSTKKETVCGACHTTTQAEWVLTAHADAWATLQDGGHSQPFCEGCHTVNQLGNPVTGAAGYLAIADPRYHDVQCESCHGPGLPHVQAPETMQPIASIAADTGLTTGCGECHSGAHHPFVDEWVQSAHGQADQNVAAGREGCDGCHSAQGALRQFGENSEYVEKGGEPLALVCAVCHDPHGGTTNAGDVIEGQLRFTVNTTETELHLCARCHDRRSIPNNTSHGLEPHSPETALLEGSAGWFPPDMPADTLIGTHSSAPQLCATCHVNSFEVVDEATGDFVIAATGHLFNAIPCVDAEGVPNTDDCAMTVEARKWTGCTGSGCHGTAAAARSALFTGTSDVRMLADSLHNLLLAVDPNLSGPGGPIDGADPTFTTEEGAYFNYELAIFGGGGEERPDPLLTYAGTTVHNPFLIKALLRGSIEAVKAKHNLVTPQDVAALRESHR